MTILAPSALYEVEAADLVRYETVIERGLQTFYDVGEALLAIRDQRLYRATFATFEAYCRERWGMAASRARQLISAAEVVRDVGSVTTVTLLNEAQARPLAAVPPAERADVWQEAVATAPNGKMTAAHVADVVQRHIAPPALDDEPLDAYEEALAAQYQAKQVESTVAPIHVAAASVEWYTPTPYVDAARQVLGVIDLDPASSAVAQRRIQAQTWHGLDHPDPAQRNGLEAEWHGRVWLNPPYGVENNRAVAAQWAAKLISEYDAGRVEEAILLVNAVIDSKWFDVLWRFPMCLTNHRIRFETTTEGIPTSPIIGSAFVYVGTRHIQAFVRAFTPFGAVVRRVTEEAE
jgi:hypothetical protein